ncbi:hypothetical protein D3H64_09395 [Atopobacter sp. AH10]|uniref:hypothetical protein n=1 Tax=Atopobacter sp. AH10 TaxID=2315861 RepID=UPI000EF25199|nr:hypothetical protein [Atopobacter sp. AH10]RLK62472.1 hypothetical protein D3H64_09395 [Atopobacter sp. AH10]
MQESAFDLWFDHLFQLRHQLKPYSVLESRLLFHAICFATPLTDPKQAKQYALTIDRYCHQPISKVMSQVEIPCPSSFLAQPLSPSNLPPIYFATSPITFPEISICYHVIRIVKPLEWDEEEIRRSITASIPHPINWLSFPQTDTKGFLPRGFTPTQYIYLLLHHFYFPYLLSLRKAIYFEECLACLHDKNEEKRIHWANKIASKLFKLLAYDDDFLLALTSNRIDDADTILFSTLDRYASLWDCSLLKDRHRKRQERYKKSLQTPHVFPSDK